MSRKHRKSHNFRPSSIPEEFRANLARKQAKQRPDTSAAMSRITTSGWDYDDEFAKLEGTSDVGYYIAETKRVRITPEDAHELFTSHNYRHNRQFDQNHSTHLSQAMKVAPGIDIAIGPSSKPEIVNGQHSLWAIYMRGETTTASVTVYQCRDEVSIARLFTIFDANKKRSQQNAIAAAQGAGDLDISLPAAKMSRYSQFVAVAEAEFRRVNLQETNAMKLDRVRRKEVQEFALWLDNLVKDIRTHKLMTQGVGAAFYAMFISDPQKGEAFIRSYVSGARLDDDSPIYKLREKMLNRPEGEHGASVCRMHAEMTYSAWRKFCLDEPVQIIRRTVDVPVFNKWKVFFGPETQSLPSEAVVTTTAPKAVPAASAKINTRLWGQPVQLGR